MIFSCENEWSRTRCVQAKAYAGRPYQFATVRLRSGGSLGSRASREYLRILELAAKESETKVDEALHRLLAEGNALTAKAVEEGIGRKTPDLREVTVAAVDLGRFDELYATAEVLQ